MPNRRYQKGYRYELKCKKALELEGWTVLRTAGSHGDADLVGYRPRAAMVWEVVFIQCKISPTKADRDKIERLRGETGLDWRLM